MGMGMGMGHRPGLAAKAPHRQAIHNQQHPNTSSISFMAVMAVIAAFNETNIYTVRSLL